MQLVLQWAHWRAVSLPNEGILARTSVAAANSLETLAQCLCLDGRADVLGKPKSPLEAGSGRAEIPPLLIDAADQAQAFYLAPAVLCRGKEA